MADFNSLAPRLMALSARFDSLRSRGQAGVRAALGVNSEANPPNALPNLQGQSLAKHHLGLALDALSEPGTSKPESFRKLRLLVNSLEQGAGPRPRPSRKTPVVVKTPTPVHLSRRARLLNKAFESAHLVSSWRHGESSEHTKSL
jgi:hypothetical protein